MECVLSVAVPSIFLEGLDYFPPDGCDAMALSPGVRVRVPLGSREVTGVLLAVKHRSDLARSRMKRAVAVLDEVPLLTDSLLQLYRWVSDYYHHPIGEVIMGTLPAKIRQPKPALLKKKPADTPWDFLSPLSLSQEQQQAVDTINQVQGYRCFLLDGVTGSGKTEVYMHVIAQVLQQRRQVLVLVPEIALTPQTLSRFSSRFTVPVVALHSGLTPAVRLQNWLLCRESLPLIVIGTRSSVFAPFAQLGLIVIDEEHDLSFKQQTGLRYSARDVAIKRARDLDISVVLGSATPSLESLHNANEGKSTHLRLKQRLGGGCMPRIQLVDLRNQTCQAGLSPPLLEAMEREIKANNQVLLFLNRRGYAPVMLCHHCGWVVRCHHCESNLVWHKQRQRLVCHHCDLRRQPPPYCPQCEQANLIPVGVGTEQLEAVLSERFADTPVIRVDRDSTRRKNSLEDKLAVLHRGEPAILVGTQMLTKGHHFPKLTLVGMIEVDSGLHGVDFRAQERLAQQLIQVAGRAGREGSDGVVMLQTHQPDSPLLLSLIQQGYAGMVASAMTQRQQMDYPPYGYLAMLQADDVSPERPEEFLRQVRHWLTPFEGKIVVYGPVPAPMEKVRGRYRSQLLLKSGTRKDLYGALHPLVRSIKDIKISRKVRWSLDVDPQTLQ